MNRTAMIRGMLAVVIGSMGLSGCGLDGVTGTLIRIDGEWYSIQTPKGEELRIHVDTHSRKDVVAAGDTVHVYVRKDGHAEFVQKLD
ncbi:hypothetical protein [Candidatus Nitrospira nitrificans]|uniref:DUF5666 domain-containing protein n=1 Tax=Candidatus Nitrospira nitrificans TaxID=1742973 RepID=A0A0S4LLS1_9BACT|nr:hypothetical protein [Candidatus Nitrospira nitrificans]CUS38207.1 exported hypothetical protein [Candidatus Nitrospira nitrificans]